MKHPLLFTGVLAAGVTAALLLDQKKGPKRRKILKKKANQFLEEATDKFQDYSRELKPYWKKYSAEFVNGTRAYSQEGIHKVEEMNHDGWSPSARMLGATAGAVAFYGAGRKGPMGTLLRTVSLGLLTKALFASR